MNTFYIASFTSSGNHTSIRQQTTYFRNYAQQHVIPFSLPIVEWAIPGVYFRLFEAITRFPSGRIFILSLDMLPRPGSVFWLLLIQYLLAYDVSIVSLGLDDNHFPYSDADRWKTRDDGTYELMPQ